MNDHDRALRDAFLAECWAPVREWHATAVERAAAEDRNAILTPVEIPVDNHSQGAA